MSSPRLERAEVFGVEQTFAGIRTTMDDALEHRIDEADALDRVGIYLRHIKKHWPEFLVRPSPNGTLESLPGRSAAAILADPSTSAPPEPVFPPFGRRKQVTLLTGREKYSGKTTLAAYGAAMGTSGRDCFGFKTEMAPVVWWAGPTESAPADVARIHSDFGGDPEHLFLIEEAGKPFELLERALEAWRPASCIVDSLSSLVGAQRIKLDSGDGLGWQAQIAPIKALAVDFDCAFILIHHENKEGGYRDSTAIGGAADMLVSVKPTKVEGEREITSIGRWRVPSMTVRLIEPEEGIPRFDVVGGGDLSLDALIVIHVQVNPGCSLRSVREGVKGAKGARTETISIAINRLLERGALRNLGSGDRLALYPGASE